MKTDGKNFSIIAGLILTLSLLVNIRTYINLVQYVPNFLTSPDGIFQMILLAASFLTVVFLFVGKQKLLLIPCTVNVFIGLISLTGSFSLYSLIDFFVSALMVAIVLVSTMTNFRHILKYIWLLPATVWLFNQSIGMVTGGFISLPTVLYITMLFIGYLAMGYWLTLTEPLESDGSVNLTIHILLLFLTCDIWYLVWIYKTTVFLNSVPGEEQRKPVLELLLCMLVPFYAVYWTYKSARRIEKLAQTKAMDCNIAVLCTVLSVLVDISAPAIMQYKINRIVKEKTEAIV